MSTASGRNLSDHSISDHSANYCFSSCFDDSSVESLDRAGDGDKQLEGKRLENKHLMVGRNQVGGLIVCYEFYAEFVGPGAIAYGPQDSGYSQIFTLGSPLLLPLTDSEAIASAYQQRCHWVAWIRRIVAMPRSVDRCRRLLQVLEGLFSPSAARSVPDSALALLVGVLPTTMATVRRGYRKRPVIPVNPKPRHTGYCIDPVSTHGAIGVGAIGAINGEVGAGNPERYQRHPSPLSIAGVIRPNAKDREVPAIA
ncbi:MAG: hypothetical protein AAF889_06260 [Cyanobacteria bacterium P01_D01_bin.73]